MKTRKIKYFQGYKKLNKNVKMFEQFVNETTIELTPNGEDDQSRVLYKGSDGKTYVDVDGTPHSVTSEGEPIAPIKDYKITGDGNKPVNEGKVDKVEEFLEEFVEKHIQGKYGFPDELFWDAGSGEKLGRYTLDHEGNESAWAEVFIERSAFEKLDFKELDRVLRDAAEGKYWDTSILSNDDDDPCSVSFSIEFGNKRFRR